jgi:hypothetical protein
MHNVIGKLKKVDRKALVYNFVLNKKHILYLFIRGMDWYILKKTPCTQMEYPICILLNSFGTDLAFTPNEYPIRYGYSTGYNLNFGVPIFQRGKQTLKLILFIFV